MIAAMANERIIGQGNQMPWHLPADLKHFKQTTLGKPVVMGRKTYESIGKALPGRQNIVISRSGFEAADADIVASPEEAMELVESQEEVMIIGGGKIYELFLPFAQTLYLTFIDLNVEGDTAFPDYAAVADWLEIASESHQPDEKNRHHYRFVTLERSL